jgi:hypothetical protein
MRNEKIFHGIHRGLKHISMVTCISGSGDHMIPFVVSAQVSGAVVWNLKIEGFRVGTEIILKKREKSCVNDELLRESISTILLPHLPTVRSNLRLAAEPAVLLMDNCSVHIRESTLRDFVAH